MKLEMRYLNMSELCGCGLIIFFPIFINKRGQHCLAMFLITFSENLFKCYDFAIQGVFKLNAKNTKND